MLKSINLAVIANKKNWLLGIVSLPLLLLLASIIYPSFRDNLLRVSVSKAFFNTSSTNSTSERLQPLLDANCAFSNNPECELESWSSNKSIIEATDRFFMSNLTPLAYVDESADIQAAELSPMGTSIANQEQSNSGTLFSEGYFQLRVFLAADSEACWRFGVRAKHDDPPPVNLALWLDDEQIGEVSFTKGDKTWETLSLTAHAKPGAYWFRVWFVNDFLDPELNVDRNAYIENIQIARVEENLCEGS